MNDLLPFVYLERSNPVFLVPCFISSVLVTGDGQNASYVDLYDGENTTQPKFARIRCLAKRSIFVPFAPPVRLQRGLFVDFEANLSSVTLSAKAV